MEESRLPIWPAHRLLDLDFDYYRMDEHSIALQPQRLCS